MSNLKFVREYIKERSDLAIKDGHELAGFLGYNIDTFTKKELIMLLNIFNSKFVKADSENRIHFL